MKVRKLTIIFNPVGGKARLADLDKVRDLFRAVGCQVTERPTTAEPGCARNFARAAVEEGCDLVVAFGGDGTVCQVAEALQGTSVAIAIFPGGTGNLFSRSYYANPRPEKFVEMVISGTPQPIDMIELEYTDTKGTAHKRLFIVGLGMGKIADAISGASPVFKRLLGKLAYVFRVMLACLIPGGRRFTFKTAGVDAHEKRAAVVFVMNVAPPMMSVISRGVNASDGLMDVVVFSGTNMWQLAKSAWFLAWGCPDRSRFYNQYRTREITITSDKPVRPNVDGDAVEKTKEVHMRVLPAAVKVVLSS